MRYILCAGYAAVVAAALTYYFTDYHKLRPLANVPLRGDAQLQERLGDAVGSVDIGFGLPCAVYRNGPKFQTQVYRGETVVIVCATP